MEIKYSVINLKSNDVVSANHPTYAEKLEAGLTSSEQRKINMQTTESVLTKKQVKTYGPTLLKPGEVIKAEVRYDDECGNGHNTFSITADIYDRYPRRGETTIGFAGKTYWNYAGGCCHDEVAKAFPELAPFIKFHLWSSNEPMHYIANGLYWAGHKGFRGTEKNDPPNLEHLKSTIGWGLLQGETDEVLKDYLYSDMRGFTWNCQRAIDLETLLKTRSNAIMEQFKLAVESLGFTF
jgi:hypothetical protein